MTEKVVGAENLTHTQRETVLGSKFVPSQQVVGGVKKNKYL